MKKLIFTILLAAVLWTVMFSPWTAPFVNFWWMMTGSALTLSVFATLFNPGWWREVKWSLPNVLLGIGIAVALWGVFWLGDKVSSWMFDFARPQVDSIYGMKEGESPWLLAALLLLLIGPAEEIFWLRLCATHAFQTLESECGFCGGYFDLCTGACRFLQLHAGHGGSGGGGGMGRALPFLSEPLCRYYLVSCSVGCGGIYIFPDMIIVYKNKAAVMGRIKTKQIDALNYKKASI